MKRILLYLLLCVLTAGIFPLPVQGAEGLGGIPVRMTSVTGQPLEGAEFLLVRELAEGELADHRVEKKMVRIGRENRIMAVASFWMDRAMTGDGQTRAVTDNAGQAFLFGLPYGTYYLVETAAPEGYDRIVDPIRIAIHKYSHLTEADALRDDQGVVIDNTLHIIHLRYALPDTGHRQRTGLLAASFGVFFSAAALLLLNRKRWK